MELQVNDHLCKVGSARLTSPSQRRLKYAGGNAPRPRAEWLLTGYHSRWFAQFCQFLIEWEEKWEI
jgi:hypothetical protein